MSNEDKVEKAIPVCTLFNDDTDNKGNTSSFFEEPKADTDSKESSLHTSGKSTSGTQLCNVFESVSSNDPFSVIAEKQAGKLGDNGQDVDFAQKVKLNCDEKDSSMDQEPCLDKTSDHTIPNPNDNIISSENEVSSEPKSNIFQETQLETSMLEGNKSMKVSHVEECFQAMNLEVGADQTTAQLAKTTNNGDVLAVVNEPKSIETVQKEKTKTEVKEPSLASSLFASAPSTNDPFASLEQQFTEDTDAFTSALSSGEIERRQQAWIPSESTRAILNTTANFKKVEAQINLTKPGISTTDSLGNPTLAQLKAQGILADSPKISAIPSTSVSQDADGLKKLVLAGNLRAAVDLTSAVLTNLGQGMSNNQPSKNCLQTLQWWNVRFSLLLRLKLFSVLEVELAKFNDFDSPDLYYPFYPDLYPGRRGSMVPFTLRLLHASLPTHLSNPSQALSRLFRIKHVTEKIIDNLKNKKTEDGMLAELKAEDKQASLDLWKRRHIMVLHCIGSTQVRLREYSLAFKVYDKIIEMEPSITVKLQSCIGRWFLQLGDIKSAQSRFAIAERHASDEPRFKSVLIMNRGFLYLGANNWTEALNHFNEAILVDSTDLEAYNNKAVCLLYLCRLKDAISTLEHAIFNNTKSLFSCEKQTRQDQQSFEGVCSNLVTLYELESARFHYKRTRLLQYIATNAGDGFDISCLKL